MAKYHETPIDRTFFALADPTRRQVLERLKSEPGLSISELAQPLPIKMPGLMKHLAVLSDAGLISRTKAGRVVTVSLAARPLSEAADWLHHFEAFWNVSLDRLAALVEEEGEA
ncbi:ArsR/SmtB family transcription factor [Chelativorans salis]|uniref:Metalloregulator ArsR/SmtB family transcription factor n=1 Tax=Chelativorans salis TaxID=2978478 RepID=A0ABT2LUT2_9HYPH|nr:metalloregulator ArsR/SmtB family transcription factor [Chelativorans sp. EGI FJ00035]MCT7378295.1 metalloregulator ArsR/SmtB family transcription factor [Chelativorans sp. EGI FJ00035]